MKVRDWRGHYLIRCQACGQPHDYGPAFAFNGDYNLPTFTPALTAPPLKPGSTAISHICTFTVTGGQITFAANCTHALKGQTLTLAEW